MYLYYHTCRKLSKVIALREVCCQCVPSDLCFYVIKYSKCVITVEVLALFTSTLSIPHLVNFGKHSDQATQPHLAFLKYALNNLDPLVVTMALDILKCAVPSSHDCYTTQFQHSSLNLGFENYVIHLPNLASNVHCAIHSLKLNP